MKKEVLLVGGPADGKKIMPETTTKYYKILHHDKDTGAVWIRYIIQGGTAKFDTEWQELFAKH